MIDKQIVTKLPDVTIKELVIAFQEVVTRAERFAHHHIQREALSVRERMSAVLNSVSADERVEFSRLFDLIEGRSGVVVTFLAILELLKESLIEAVQAQAYGPIHIRAARSEPHESAAADTEESEVTQG